MLDETLLVRICDKIFELHPFFDLYIFGALKGHFGLIAPLEDYHELLSLLRVVISTTVYVIDVDWAYHVAPVVLKVKYRFLCREEECFGVIGFFTPVKVGAGTRARRYLIEICAAAGRPILAIELQRADILRNSCVGLAIKTCWNASGHHEVILESTCVIIEQIEMAYLYLIVFVAEQNFEFMHGINHRNT